MRCLLGSTKNGSGSARVGLKRGLKVGVGTFLLATIFVLPTVSLFGNSPLYIAFPALLTIILFGIVFDVIGVAVAAADETPFHALAAKKTPGARWAIWLVRNADRVSSFCNDIVGDVAGTLSGASAAAIVVQLVSMASADRRLDQIINIAVIGLVAAFTVGGKAAGKSFAFSQAQWVVGRVGLVLHWFDSTTGLWMRRKTKNFRRRKT